MRKPLIADAAFGTVLIALALLGLRTTYAGWWFLVAGGVGMLLGLFASVPLLLRRQPLVGVVGAVVLLYFLTGSAVIDRAHAIAGVVPTALTLHEQALSTVHGWKDVLTTLPPVATSGPLLIVPFVLGLVASALTVTLAVRVRAAVVPVLAPVAVLAITIALGTHDPGARLLDSVVFAAVALVWIAVRAGRGNHTERPISASVTRLVSGAAVLAVAALAVGAASPLLPGANTTGRVVLRDYVTPPFDLSAYPSPLVGYRKYTKDARQLYDQTLFTVSGLPAGVPVRIATLDNYDGSVWGAMNVPGDEFQRVGSTIPATSSGKAYAVHVTIAPAYAAAGDADVWLPDAGALVGMHFAGSDASTLAGGFRFNASTSTGVVSTGLRSGDSYTFDMLDDAASMPINAQPYGPSQLVNNYASLVAARTAQWTKSADGLGPQIAAVESYFANDGAY
ncbi:MAG TPA: hypothetical protein VGJ28_05095, partial [Micromonosporaceae bacterium]